MHRIANPPSRNGRIGSSPILTAKNRLSKKDLKNRLQKTCFLEILGGSSVKFHAPNESLKYVNLLIKCPHFLELLKFALVSLNKPLYNIFIR